jgi:hypothetical protein
MPSFKLTSILFAAFSLTAATVGCAADATTDAEDDVEAAEEAMFGATRIEEATFKLYPEPHAAPNPMCDIHTVLELKNQPSGRAALHEAVDGFCKIGVIPDAREYRLRRAGTSCGSTIYKGRRRVKGAWRNITVTDHRTRICRDLVPARVIVEETDRFGELQTKYSHDAAPAPKVGTWLTIAPRQCGTNPWNGAGPAAGQGPSYLPGEAGEVDDFFRGQGISLEQIGFAHPSEPRMVCMACSCPRGDTLVVKAKSAEDAQRLVSDFGFAEATDTLTTSPTQCGSNPWESGQQTDRRTEAQRLASWAAAAGAPLEEAGFLDRTEPMMVCMACQCPRGDTAIAIPTDATSAAKLENLGWTRLEN